MQIRATPKSPFGSFLVIATLVFHEAVQNVRKKDGSAAMAIFKAIMTNIIMLGFFYAMIFILGTRSSPIRGNMIVYIISGVFVYMTHIQAVGAVSGAMGPASAMNMHAPLTPAVSILSNALSALYIQVLSMCVILPGAYFLTGPLGMKDPIGFSKVLLLAWFSGVAIGLVFYALMPVLPMPTTIAKLIYMRINMIASGKMFVVNTLPASMISMFDWNPLFHLTDQARGTLFYNYFPHHTNLSYPLYISLVFLALGLMLEFSSRKVVSASWAAKR